MEKYSTSLWVRTLSCGIHIFLVIILSAFVLAELMKLSVGVFIKDSTKSLLEKKNLNVVFFLVID